MKAAQNMSFINAIWDESIVPSLIDYIKIPNKSPQFDPNWHQNGYMYQAVELIRQWCLSQNIPGMQLEVIQAENRTPLIFIDIPGKSNDTILLYGHLDKQPEMTGWDEDLAPWKPVLRGEKLYGRGSADDGYAAYASLAAILSLQNQQVSHARCLILIEASEESGSTDLPYYIDALKDRIGKPQLVICLDSGCGNYNQLWVTTSLRGLVGGTLTIQVLKQGVHSGSGSGVVPSCFRILRQLINRIEEETTGNIILSDLQVTIPDERIKQAQAAAQVLGKSIFADLPFAPDVHPESDSLPELILRRTWKPALSITGIEGMPTLQHAGNVTLPQLSTKFSLRLAPTSDPAEAAALLKAALEAQAPYAANINFQINDTGPGWNAPKEAPWLVEAVNQASENYFGDKAVYMGEGGSIPFMGMLGKKFPQAQFLITGLLGPGSNAHGPNEFLHIPTGKKLTACVAEVIAKQYEQR